MRNYQRFAIACCVVAMGLPVAHADALRVQTRLDELEARFRTELNAWRAQVGDVEGAERADFDDSAWPLVDIGFEWEEPNSICWFRRWIDVPKTVGGVPVDSATLALRMDVDNGGSVYVDGELVQAQFDWADGYAVLTESAKPGQRFFVAIRGINRPGWGVLKGAELESSATLEIVPDTSAFLEKARLAASVLQTNSTQTDWTNGVSMALDVLDFDRLEKGDTEGYLASVTQAEQVLDYEAVSLIRRDTRDRIDALQEPVAELARLIAQDDGVDRSYPRVTLTVANEFLRFALDDLESESLRIVTRGRWNADWIANAVTRAIADQRRLEVPRYKTGQVTIRDGAFWQGQQPLFFVGMGHFGQVRKDIPIFSDYGFNIIQVVISVSAVLPREGEVNEAQINELIAVLDRAAAHNVAVDVLIEPHGWPRWAIEKYPEMAYETHGFMKYKIDHPKAQEILKQYVSELVPRLKGHPALFSYCLFNEPTYSDTSAFSHERFQGWLRDLHGDLETLNRRHGARYDSFETVPMPTGVLDETTRGEKPILASADSGEAPLLYDWYRFNQDRFSEAHHAVVETVRELDPDTPVHSKVQGNLFDSYRTFATGIDHEQWTSATNISGNDNWSYYRSWIEHDPAIAGEYASNWWRQAMYYDFQRSVAPGQPLFNSENHPIEDDTPIWVAGRHIRTVYWQGAIHGQGATTTWVWQRGDEKSIGDSIITRANCAHALGTVGLDLLRLGEEVVALQSVEPEIALLVVPSSIPFSEEYLSAMKQAYEGLCFLGAPIGLVTERQAAAGGLAKYNAIVVPGAKRVSDALVANLSEYAKGGGTLVLVGNSLAEDEYGQTRESFRFTSEEKVIKRDALDLEEYQRLGEALMADLDVQRPVRVTDEQGRMVNGVEYRSVTYKDGYLLNLVSYRQHEIPVRLAASSRMARVTNLFNGDVVGDFLELDPLDPLLLYVEIDQ